MGVRARVGTFNSILCPEAIAWGLVRGGSQALSAGKSPAGVGGELRLTWKPVVVTQAAPAGGLRRGRLGAELGGTERAVTPEKGLPRNTMSFIEAGPP